MNSTWIGSPTDIRHGEKASEALKSTNDITYWSDELGATRVDDERWGKVLRHKMISRQNLDNLCHLPTSLGRVLEINCGLHPRVVPLSRKRAIGEITLLDPLLTEYQRDPACQYSRLNPRPHLLAIDITEYNRENIFDTIIAIGFLERTKDAIIALKTIQKALKPYGILIFIAETYDKLDPTKVYDSSKPIRVKTKVIRVFRECFNIVDSDEENSEYGLKMSFVGRKPAI